MHTLCCSLTSTQVKAQEAHAPEIDQPSYICHTEAGTATCTDEAGSQAYRQEYTHRLAKVVWTQGHIYTESTAQRNSPRICCTTPLFSFGVCAQSFCADSQAPECLVSTIFELPRTRYPCRQHAVTTGPYSLLFPAQATANTLSQRKLSKSGYSFPFSICATK